MGEVTQLSLAEGAPQLGAPEAITANHDLSVFDCGNADLNRWLVNRALASEGKSARTVVVAVGNAVVAYYCISAGAVERNAFASAKQRRNQPDPIPVLVLGRLAVDKGYAGRGFGKGLLKDAILRTLTASEIAGVRALVVHAIDDEAAKFYKKFGFVASPLNSRTYLLPIETAKAAL